MTAVPVTLAAPHTSQVVVLPTVPRVGEHVHWKGEDYIVERVIHVISEHPAHVRVVLSK